MLDVKNARKVFERGTAIEHAALNGLTLHMDEGEFATVVGSNGAGKSTLFNAICGTFWLDSGSIALGGRDITFLPEHKRARTVGRVFQDPMKGTSPDMEIAENLAIASRRGIRRRFVMGVRRADRAKYKELLASLELGLEDRLSTKVGLLSGGQRQAITLLMATMNRPKLLLLDEHTAALDPKTAAKVLELTDQIVHKNKLTTLMITHNMKDAIAHSNRLIMMYDGNVLIDVSGEEKKNLTVEQLLSLFHSASHDGAVNDRLVLN